MPHKEDMANGRTGGSFLVARLSQEKVRKMPCIEKYTKNWMLRYPLIDSFVPWSTITRNFI